MALKDLFQSAVHWTADTFLLTRLAFVVASRTQRKRRASIPISEIRQIHGLTKARTIAKLERRKGICTRNRAAILNCGLISNEFLRRYLPSATDVTVVQSTDGYYYAMDGNGRLEALQSVFRDHPAIRVEVDELVLYCCDTIFRLLEEYRRFQGLLPGSGNGFSKAA